MNTNIENIIKDGDIIKTNTDILLFNPFNPENNEITLNDIQFILKKYGIHTKIDNIKLYQRAFVHKSYTKRPNIENVESNIEIAPQPNNCLPLKTKSNERLEFIGDGVLELITKYYLYRRFPKADEGFMTEKKIALVKNEHIGLLAYEMNLHKFLILSKHAEEKKTRTNLKKLGCLFEAFIGALFLDFNKISINDEQGWFQNVFVSGPGFQMAQIFIENIYENHVDWIKLISTDDNFKNILQVIIQKEFKTTPEYIEIEHDVEIGYKMGVYLCLGKSIHQCNSNEAIPFLHFQNFEKIHEYISQNNNVLIFFSYGIHKIKRKAEQIACERAIKILQT
jgi:dsRNA-specific ribonuclease